MDSYTSMKTKLNATGFYTVQEGTALSRELIAYSRGLSLLFNELKEMLRELFIHTAQTYGIENRERFVGKTRDEYTLEKRREMLIITESNIGTGCTLNDFTKMLNGYGLENFEFIENPTAFKLTIVIHDTLTDAQKNLVKQKVAQDFPLHLSVEIQYS